MMDEVEPLFPTRGVMYSAKHRDEERFNISKVQIFIAALLKSKFKSKTKKAFIRKNICD